MIHTPLVYNYIENNISPIFFYLMLSFIFFELLVDEHTEV